MKFAFSAFFVLIHLACSVPDTEGTVVKVIDGDTFDVRQGQAQVRVRLFGIDAPERGQAFNRKSKEYMASLVSGKKLRLVVKNKDQYGRTVADAFLADGTHVNAEMVKAGYAWHFRQFSDSKEMARFEQEARSRKKGLWQDEHPVSPWEYRRDARKRTVQDKNGPAVNP